MRISGEWKTREVTVDGKRLTPYASQRVWDHSPDGFCWAYTGSGPAQLALAILLHAGVPQDKAVERHQELKREVIAGLPQGDFEIDLDVTPEGAWQVKSWLSPDGSWSTHPLPPNRPA